jgi:hypothetical protein
VLLVADQQLCCIAAGSAGNFGHVIRQKRESRNPALWTPLVPEYRVRRA